MFIFSIRLDKHFWTTLIPVHRNAHLIVSFRSLGVTQWFTAWLTLAPSPLFYCLSFCFFHKNKKDRLATVRSSDQHHLWHPRGPSLLISNISLIAWPQTLPLGVRQLLSLAANVTVTQVIGTLCWLSGLLPFSPPPPVKQRKFSQRAINIKWNPV